MSEWLIELVSKTSVLVRVPRVRIPPSPFHINLDSQRDENTHLWIHSVNAASLLLKIVIYVNFEPVVNKKTKKIIDKRK